MYSFRRAACRALSSPTTPFLLKPRSITTVTPSALRINRQIPNLAFQRRWSSDETSGSSTGVYDGSALFGEAEKPSRPSSSFSQRSPASASENSDTPSFSPRERRPLKPAEPNETVYIGNLFFDVTAEDLKGELQRFGAVQSAKIVYDGRGLSRGFAYVTFDSIDSATSAVEGMHQQVYEGRRVTVQFSNSRGNTSPQRTLKSPTKTLFIGNMSFEMSDADLNALFKDIRNVIDVRVAVDRRTGTPRGFAHADFVDIKSAEQAMEKLQNKSPYGRKLRLDYSTSKQDNNRKQPESENSEDEEL